MLGVATDADRRDLFTVTVSDEPAGQADQTVLSISGDKSVVEGQSAHYTLNLTNKSQTEVTVNLKYSGTAANGSDYQGLASVVSSGAGKLAIGQKAFIELIDYPKTEFGMLEGTVISMTQIEKGGKYEVKIGLKDQLKTTYNKYIPAKAQFKGSVKIITKDKRLLARFFERLTGLIK
mgnify:CR=1 FL=1